MATKTRVFQAAIPCRSYPRLGFAEVAQRSKSSVGDALVVRPVRRKSGDLARVFAIFRFMADGREPAPNGWACATCRHRGQGEVR